MNRDELITKLANELTVWPHKNDYPRNILPEGCRWSRGGLTQSWIAWPPEGKGVGEEDWEERQRFTGVTSEEDEAFEALTGKTPTTAPAIVSAALGHMQDRAATYDAPSGERSMGKTVAAFNALTGRDLTEPEGWLLMAVLKMARSTQGGFRADNYEDLAAYAGLYGEASARETNHG